PRREDDPGRVDDVRGGVIPAPLAGVRLHQFVRDAAERRRPRCPVSVAKRDLEVRGALAWRVGEYLRSLVDVLDEPLPRGRVDLRLEPARDRVEESVVLGARCDPPPTLAPAEVHVDLPGAERVGARARPVDAGKEVVVLAAGRNPALGEEPVVAEP